MPDTSSNLRKAAVLIRGLDGETAATLLAQLSAGEAAAIREAIRSLGSVDEVEQASVAAELRRGRSVAAHAEESGVELKLSSLEDSTLDDTMGSETRRGNRFDFLENAPVETIAAYLAREHVQTTAVVLSQLPPTRAVVVLGALPAKLQADTLDRLSRLGESDPESLSVVESELAAWVARQPVARRNMAPVSNAVQNILAAADEATRGRILSNLHRHNQRLAAQFHRSSALFSVSKKVVEPPRLPPAPRPLSRPPITPLVRATAAATFKFDDLMLLRDNDLTDLLHDLDPHLLVLALVGCSEDLVERIAKRMPKQEATVFRRQLRSLGPTRLSDVESAQRAVADAVGKRLAQRRHQSPAAAL